MKPPEDPFKDIDEGAVAQHEMFTSWVRAGFTEAQALEIIKAVVVAMVAKAVDEC